MMNYPKHLLSLLVALSILAGLPAKELPVVKSEEVGMSSAKLA